MKTTKELLNFWEDQMKLSHTSSNYFFRKSPSHYHMMLLVMDAYKSQENLTVEELKTKLFKTSRPKSALMINEACEKKFFFLEKTSNDQRKKFIKPTSEFIKEFEDYLKRLKEISI
jgi:glycerol-3-phosphate O-acyltransferase